MKKGNTHRPVLGHLTAKLALALGGLLLPCLLPNALAGTVTTLNDSGPGSLRQAIADATPGDTIDFAVTGTITLTNGQLAIGKPLTIIGPGTKNLKISGNNAGRVFYVGGYPISIAALTIADGRAASYGYPDSNSGGGIRINHANLWLTDCVITNCTCFDYGSAIFNSGGLLTMSRCTVSGNGDRWSGVLWNDNWGSIGATNCTISGNNGVGIWNYEGSVQLGSCTICSNSVGIWQRAGPFTVQNTVIAGSVGADCHGPFDSLDYNLIGNTNGAVITGDTTHNIYGQDPLLGPLADNGGPTPTHALLPGSPAIDAGSSGGLATDQRGLPRPFRYPSYPAADDGSDIGAYERSPATLYVWQDSPSPAAPYAKWTSAAHTIQAAVDAAMDGDTVLVTNGVYATGGRAVWGLMTNRVAIDRAILVQSVNGPAVSVIQGNPAPGGGLGDGAIRGAYVGNSGVLSGFTVTNGFTVGDVFGHLTPGTSGGGVWCEAAAKVTNCTLVGNQAYFGGGAYHGTLEHCTLLWNKALPGGGTVGTGGGAYEATLSSCMVVSNSCGYYGGGAFGGVLYQCTIKGNSSLYAGGGVTLSTVYRSIFQGNSAGWSPSNGSGGAAYDGTLFNCILADNFTGGPGSAAAGGSLYNCTVVTNWCTAPGYGGMAVYQAGIQNCIVSYNTPYDTYQTTEDHSYVGGDPKFVNKAFGDYRLRWNSPCIDAGADLSATITNDIAGNLRPVDGSGGGIAVFDIGAYEFIPVPPVITNQPITQTIAPNGQVTFTVGDTGNPPPTYQWYFAGSPIPWATGPSLTITNAGPGQVGCYSVAVTNFAGGFVSAPACLWLSTLKMYAGVNVYGPLGGTCTVQYATNLDLVPVQWTTLTNAVIEAMPQIFIDYGSADQPKRFYRTVPQ